MKNKLSLLLIAFGMVCLLLGLFVLHQWRQPRVLAEVVWEAPHNRAKPGWIESWWGRFLQRPRQVDTYALNSSSSLPDFSSERVRQPDGTDEFKARWKGKTALGGPTLADFMFMKGLTPGAHYAVTGAIRRENLDSACCLQMTSLIFVGTVKKEGRIANQTFYNVDRNADWQPFALLVDESKMDFSLAGFLVNLQMSGPNTVEVRDLKFVQYSGTMDPLKLAPTSMTSGQIDGWIGAGFAVLLVALSGALFLVLRQQRREREMRRIASLDS
jgi:hypothetical protein